MGKPHILIAGGGIGGMAAALALLRKGFDVDIYEQAEQFREVGAGIQISPNGNRALHALGVFETLQALSTKAEGKEIRLWNTGQTWKLFDLGKEAINRYGFPYLTVFRPDLLQVLADAVARLKPDALHLNTRVVGCTQTGGKVTLAFDNGGTATGDVLIGADGVHSKIRNILHGESKARFTGMMAWRGVIPMETLPEHMTRRVATNWVGPGAHVVCYPLRGGKLMNFVATVERTGWQSDSWSTQGSVEECMGDFIGWHADIQTMIAKAPSLFKWALMGWPPMESWTVGNTTLLGDACHSTLPFLAQGAVMALEDAVILGRAFETHGSDIGETLRRYEAARIDVTRQKVLGATANTERFHNPLLATVAGAQAYVDREWSREAIIHRYEWIFTYDVNTVTV
ncbi:FAD-dependent monooxygenase [Magnetospirillum sp. 15-1]|uniref:FAD-dependent monooxygenase n=1 Tax=Magnetospirillum sp. 15-1 TaxID=1979370 RepID=UPI000BBBEF42|nr:FAD-dependent monooxygenase [Magnetospirillum sp. 15-1]